MPHTLATDVPTPAFVHRGCAEFSPIPSPRRIGTQRQRTWGGPRPRYHFVPEQRAAQVRRCSGCALERRMQDAGNTSRPIGRGQGVNS
jgi:hypothetical protein